MSIICCFSHNIYIFGGCTTMPLPSRLIYHRFGFQSCIITVSTSIHLKYRYWYLRRVHHFLNVWSCCWKENIHINSLASNFYPTVRGGSLTFIYTEIFLSLSIKHRKWSFTLYGRYTWKWGQTVYGWLTAWSDVSFAVWDASPYKEYIFTSVRVLVGALSYWTIPWSLAGTEWISWG